MAVKDQDKHLAPALSSHLSSRNDIIDSENDTNFYYAGANDRNRKRFIKCCGCVAAILVIAAVTLLILAFTIFHIRGPMVRINALTGFKNIPVNATNITLTADVSFKNPNALSVRYKETVTTVYYRDGAITEVVGPGGVLRPRRTVRMNITGSIALGTLFTRPGFWNDIEVNALTVESYTRVYGRVKIANIVRRKVEVHVNCTVTLHTLTEEISMQHCKSDIQI